MNTTAIPTDIARILAERAREDLEHAAEQHADYVTKAHELRKAGDKEKTPEAAAVYYAQAERIDVKVYRSEIEFLTLERVCKALTSAGV